MLHGKHLHRVVLRFQKDAAYEHIKKKCAFGFIEEREAGGQIEMTVLTDSLPVLARWLLDLDTDVEILSPPELKAILKEYASAIARRYLDTL